MHPDWKPQQRSRKAGPATTVTRMLALGVLLLAVACGSERGMDGLAPTPDEAVDRAGVDESGASVPQGQDAVSRAQSALATGDPNDPMLRMRLGDAYRALGQDDAALKEYLWCFDEGEQHGEGFHGVRLSFLLSYIEELGRRYPPAMTALFERRDAAEKRIVDGAAEYDDIAVFSSINRALDEDESTIALYERVKESGRLSAPTLQAFGEQVFDLLLDARRYQRILDEYDVVGRADQRFETYETFMPLFEDLDAILKNAGDSISDRMRDEIAEIAQDEELQEQIRQSQQDLLRQEVASAYEVLIGTGMFDEAAVVAQRLVGSLDDADTRHALARAGYRTGSPIEANIAQAREAFALTDGDDLDMVDTLARVLATLGERDEAIAIARSGLEKATTRQDRKRMEDCLAYCERSSGA